VTGQRSNRLVCRPSQRLGQQVFRNVCLSHLILFGPCQADKSRFSPAARSLALTSTPSACARPQFVPHRVLFNLFQSFPIAGEARSKLQRPRFARYQSANWTKMSIVLSMAIGPTPVPRNFGLISMQSMINRSHPEASYSSCTSSFQQPVSRSNRSFPIFGNVPVDAVS